MTNGLWDIGTASTLVKSLPAQLRFHQCFPSTSSIIAAGAVVGPVVDSFDGKDYSDSRKQDLIKRAIGRNHPAFPFPLDSLFGGWLVYDRKNPNKTPADPLILCTALSNFHHKYNPAQPTFLVRLPGKDLKFDDANTKAFDNPKHDYPMLGTTEVCNPLLSPLLVSRSLTFPFSTEYLLPPTFRRSPLSITSRSC